MNKVEEPLNCWEYMLCGREPGGAHAKDLGVCRTALEERLNGTHGGMNGGRACWVVAGTLGKQTVSCTFAVQGMKCRSCDFYKIVKEEEGDNFRPTFFLIKLLEEEAS